MQNFSIKKGLGKNLGLELKHFLTSLHTPIALQSELNQLAQVASTRYITNTKRHQEQIAYFLALLFIGVYPQLKTEANRVLVLQFLIKLFKI